MLRNYYVVLCLFLQLDSLDCKIEHLVCLSLQDSKQSSSTNGDINHWYSYLGLLSSPQRPSAAHGLWS